MADRSMGRVRGFQVAGGNASLPAETPDASPRVVAAVLAAGLARRFTGFKPLAPLGTSTLLGTTLEGLRSADLHRTLLVVGHRAQEVLEAIETNGMEVVHNPRYREGMSTSLQAGFRVLHGDEEGVLIVLGDQPFVRPDTIDRLREAYAATRPMAAVPTHRGQRGNPVLLSPLLRGEVERLSGDVGCRDLLRKRRDILLVEVDDPGILLDVDTEADLARARAAAQEGLHA